MIQENQEVAADTENTAGEGEGAVETIAIPKTDYEKLNQTLGSLKRELKDLRKPKEESKETPKNQSDDNGLIQKAYLRSASITAEDEVDLALTTAKKWDMPIDKLVDDEDFLIKLEKLRTSKANIDATSKIRGGKGSSDTKNDPAYWIAKGAPPTQDQVPDRKTRATIARAMMANQKSSKKFYND
jgi:hypothetical protein